MPSHDESTVRLLVVDDDPANLELIRGALAREELQILSATDLERSLELIRDQRPQIVLLDPVMEKTGGLQMLARILEMDPGIDVILLTGHYSAESAVQAIKMGACDYLTKPISVERLRHRIGELLGEARRRQQSLELDRKLLEAYQLEGIVGRSPALLEVFKKIRRVAPHFRTVLITGETGTGKELAARVLHRLSPVASKPFVACNCSALTETLIESELFGYVRGAFTGATQDKVGLFEHAHGGALLLDEIGDMPLAMQAKILRVLEVGEIQRVGSPMMRKVEVRVIAATNRDLRAMVEGKTFRDDLYYRLAMVEIGLPSLRERPEDLPLLERHFVELFAAKYNKLIRGLTRRAQMLLAGYPWPGNVRELENVLGHACMMTESNTVDVRDLPAALQHQKPHLIAQERALLPLNQMIELYVRRVLDSVGGNKRRAAEILGIGRTTLYRILARNGNGEIKQEVSKGS